MNNSSPIIVAGAGIIGTSIAYHLAKVGARVVILDKGEPAQGTTAASFAWINASRGKTPFHYYLLNRLGIGAWHQLEKELDGQLQVTWGGSLEWGADATETEAMLAATRQHQQNGYPLQVIDSQQFAQLEPNVVMGEEKTAVFTPIEGHVDPVAATHALLNQAQAMGAELHTNCQLVGLNRPNGQLQSVQTTLGDMAAAKLIIACGIGSPQVAALVGLTIPLQKSPGVLAHAKPMPSLISRVILSPHGHIKQKADGRFVVGSSFSGTDGEDNSLAAGQRLFERATHSLPQLGAVEIEKMTLGWRVLPQGGLPIIGSPLKIPDIYLAAMHSGITLGPLVGQLAAIELVDGVKVEILEPYRLERFG